MPIKFNNAIFKSNTHIIKTTSNEFELNGVQVIVPERYQGNSGLRQAYVDGIADGLLDMHSGKPATINLIDES